MSPEIPPVFLWEIFKTNLKPITADETNRFGSCRGFQCVSRSTVRAVLLSCVFQEALPGTGFLKWETPVNICFNIQRGRHLDDLGDFWTPARVKPKTTHRKWSNFMKMYRPVYLTPSKGLKKPTDAYRCIYLINANVGILIYWMPVSMCVSVSACGIVDVHVRLYICAYVCASTVCVSINVGTRLDEPGCGCLPIGVHHRTCGYHQCQREATPRGLLPI